MKKSIGSILIRVLKISGIVIASILVLLFLLPYIFPGFVSTKIKEWANNAVTTEMNFSKARLSFFRHFPALTLTLHDLTIMGSKPYEKDTLVKADELGLGIDLTTVFSSSLHINKIFVEKANLNIEVDKDGRANYNIYESKKDSSSRRPKDTSGAALKIEAIIIRNSHLVYNDKSVPMLIDARGLDYEGHGDLSKAIFDLYSHFDIESTDFYYDNKSYILSKKLGADLITKINTNSLAFLFEKNDLKLNQLPVQFNGRFEFLPDGYDMDFALETIDTDLHDMCTALPPEYAKWLEKTEVKGQGDITATLKGKYIAQKNKMPDLALNMKVRNGFIANEQAPSPVKNLFMNMQCLVPNLEPDSFNLRIDSIFFNEDRDYMSAIIHTKGLDNPEIYAKINSEIDLGKLDKALGIAPIDMKGQYSVHLLAEGRYATGVVQKGLRKMDTVIVSIPKFSLHSSLSNGYFKYASLPEAVKDISFKLDASCPDNNYKNTSLSIENINANVLNNFIKGFIRLKDPDNPVVDADLHSIFHLADIKKVYPLDSMDISGDLNMDIKANGQYVAAKKMFPVAVANLKLADGMIRTPYYPHPIEKIQVSAAVTNNNGSFNSLKVQLSPISFEFEGQPFTMMADLKDFTNLSYNITSRGIVDIGKIYKVFAQKGYDVKGFIKTDLALKGRQSDAIAGLYNKLINTGTLQVNDLQLSADLFPMPFLIKQGVFRFNQDKIWFDAFKAYYGKSDFSLNGYLNNVIDYATTKNAVLRGNLALSSNYINLNEFMVYSGGAGDPPSSNSSNSSASTSDGVIMVPTNLGITFDASVKKIQYGDIILNDFKGQAIIDSGKLKLNQTGFNLIGTTVSMDGSYKSISPYKALFDYHIKASDFDVKRAYKEIKMFRDMASAAEKAEGIISLDYSLNGRLDSNMHPVYPSLKGGGVLSVKKVKFKGLKLFTVVSKETDKDVKDPDLSKVDIKSTINKNIIHIQRTRAKISVFRFRFEGDVSLDGKLSMKMRLGLPPFGIIGIPMKVTGTQENPKVSVGKSTDKDELEEKEDIDTSNQ